MPRLIVKIPYTKGRARKTSAHLKNYVRYMATREGAEKPLSPNFQQKENYTQHIASRPRAERVSDHALFSGADEPVVLSQVVKEVANHPGNVWKPIISLRREDAERLGYDNAQTWKNLLTSFSVEMAQAMKIPLEQFRWYAAFHDEGHHPHVHMVCYSADGKSGFLTKEGLAKIKSGLAKEIFRQELTEIYSRQTQRRDSLTTETKNVLEKLVQRIQDGDPESERAGQLLLQLAEKLKTVGGKKQYGYLKAPLKDLVDEVVEELAKDPLVAKSYDLWYELREDVLRTYKDAMPKRIPLSQQKEFKQVKNLVVREAVRLGECLSLFSPQDVPQENVIDDEPQTDDFDTPGNKVDWSDRYKMAREFLYGNDTNPPDFEKAFDLFLAEAEKGNALAMYDLGRMFADGLGREMDMEQAQGWYKKALDTFLVVDSTPYVEYRIGKMHAAGLGTEQDYSQAASWFDEAAEQGNKFAMYSLAGLYLRGQGVEKDEVKAKELYRKSAAKGVPYAAYELAKLYRDGIGGETDARIAEEYFSQAFLGFRSMEQESHDDKLQYRIGWMLLRGVGTEKDEVAARVWLEKASRLGNPCAQYQLAKIILADPDSSPEQVDNAIEWLTRAAEGGNEFAQYALGKLLLEKGEEETGIRWLTMAAEQENPFAQYALGKLLLEKGDKENGVRWLTASAEQGNIYAQYYLLHLDDFRDQLVRQGVVRLFHHLGNLFLEQLPPAGQGVKMGTDHKLRRKLREKKAAQGHKRDDHEPVMTS